MFGEDATETLHSSVVVAALESLHSKFKVQPGRVHGWQNEEAPQNIPLDELQGAHQDENQGEHHHGRGAEPTDIALITRCIGEGSDDQ